MINKIPLIGWLIDFILNVSVAVPFYVIWTVCGMGVKYFSFLPVIYLSPGFWDCVGVFIVMPILKGVLVPTIVSVAQTNNNANK